MIDKNLFTIIREQWLETSEGKLKSERLKKWLKSEKEGVGLIRASMAAENWSKL